ncbi:MAG: hypothetical protein C4562_03770 [Actinobacteria bacterium]|nr:MAG: hypothetical protein C4562_03770 [Actinomycetota bacterium]
MFPSVKIKNKSEKLKKNYKRTVISYKIIRQNKTYVTCLFEFLFTALILYIFVFTSATYKLLLSLWINLQKCYSFT